MLVFFKVKREQEREWNRGGAERVEKLIFRERTSDFSLKYRAIRPSEVFGVRRKAVLRGAGYTWTPVLGIFVKLRKVGVSSYLGFTLCLSVFTMFELIEAVSGRLIGPKSWDRIVGNFWRGFVQSMDCLVILCDELCINSCVGLYKAGNGREIRVYKVNR